MQRHRFLYSEDRSKNRNSTDIGSMTEAKIRLEYVNSTYLLKARRPTFSVGIVYIRALVYYCDKARKRLLYKQRRAYTFVPFAVLGCSYYCNTFHKFTQVKLYGK